MEGGVEGGVRRRAVGWRGLQKNVGIMERWRMWVVGWVAGWVVNGMWMRMVQSGSWSVGDEEGWMVERETGRKRWDGSEQR